MTLREKGHRKGRSLGGWGGGGFFAGGDTICMYIYIYIYIYIRRPQLERGRHQLPLQNPVPYSLPPGLPPPYSPYWPRISDAAESLENAETLQILWFRAVADLSVLRPACAPISHAPGDAHDARIIEASAPGRKGREGLWRQDVEGGCHNMALDLPPPHTPACARK